MGPDDNDAFPGYSRKRMKKEKTWKKAEAKKKRNSGEEYVSRHTNAVVPALQIGGSALLIKAHNPRRIACNPPRLTTPETYKTNSYNEDTVLS
ncbi:hypothetical protein AVEN_163253-1 [Araneus ventricosus]|uniref:Uncharacterized protein n=1 Tax=Araneus ventricosus TaxID=182803 RepID=A0A4Y2LJP7_ARAVE|nr:hypothetical protein AVEN_163253-1 [Araneus ventricosus]